MRPKHISIGIATVLAVWLVVQLMAQVSAAPPHDEGTEGDSVPIFFVITPTPCPGCTPAPTPTATPVPVDTGFTYQGQLKQGGGAVSGQCDLQFHLYDDDTAGGQVGPTVTRTNVTVADGLFTTNLDFGAAALTGEARWLGVAVRCPAGSGGYTVLSPRQPVKAAPYALALRPGATIEASKANAGGLSVINQIEGGWGVYGQGGKYGVFGHSVYSPTNSLPTGIGVFGYGGFNGVMGESSSTYGNGVMGVADGGFTAWGVLGRSKQGVGVVGKSQAGIGVWGVHTNATGTPQPGVRGETASRAPFAVGVEGIVSSQSPGSSSAAVRGRNEGTGGSGIGVWGSHDGSGYGVYGTSNSGRAVYGAASDVSGTGGYFTNNGAGIALYGAGNGLGVNEAALRVNNSNTAQGVAAYLTNDSPFSTTQLENDGSGIVLRLHNGGSDASGTGGGDFIRAYNNPASDIQFRVTTDGDVRADGQFTSPAADFAEMLPAKAGMTAGEVLVIGDDGELTRSTQPYQSAVVGVYSTKPGFVGGHPLDGDTRGKVPLAVVGVVPVKATTENGAIRPGDLLTTSSLAGHAMRAGANPPVGTVIGKALGSLKDGTGVIQMLVVLQ